MVVLDSRPEDTLRVGLAQISPVWLDRAATLDKVATWIERAADEGCQLVVFGEALVPGYPFWLERTDGARFESPRQKAFHAHYLDQAVQPERGDLDGLRELCGRRGIEVVLGTIERAEDRGGHSVYCTLVQLGADGSLRNRHRKLVPTYEERLSWSPGDGSGLRVHGVGPFTVGALNCWENWMPLARVALSGQGEDLHVSIWPGGEHNTRDLTPVQAKEGRSYVLAVSGLMGVDDIPADVPFRDELIAGCQGDWLANGGSCIANPDGTWLIEPVLEREELLVADLDHAFVRRERTCFDPVGHYSRPDVLRLQVDRRRQKVVDTQDD